MSKLKRLLGALSLVALFIFSSCVDDEVAPEVAALRQAQVDLLNADAAFRAAETALKNADVAFRDAQTAGEMAMTAFTEANTASITIGNDQTLALNALALELATEQNKAALVAAEQALLAAQADLAQYLATAGLDAAAGYLATWNAIMTGGPAPDLADNVPAGGLAGLAKDIGAKQAEIAGLSLFYTTSLSPGPQIPQSVLIARAQEDVIAAEAGLVGLNASIEAAKAVIDGADNPAASLEMALLALAADTVAQNAKIDSIAAVVDAIDAGLSREDSIISAFENQATGTGLTSNRTGYTSLEISGVHMDNFVTKGANWVSQKNTIDARNATIKTAAADTVLYLSYADSLEGVYNKYKATLDDFEAYIKPFRDDSIAAADALAAAQPSGVAAPNEIAHAAYVSALAVFEVKSNNYLNGLTATSGADAFNGGVTAMTGTTYGGDNTILNAAAKPTLADTTALVNARIAWDGLTKNLMFTEWDDDRYDTNQGGTRFTDQLIGANIDKLFAPNRETDGIDNASDNPYSNFNSGVDPALRDAVDVANALLAAAEAQYELALFEFGKLNAAVASLRAQTYTQKQFMPTNFAPDVIAAGPTFEDYVSEVNGAYDDILDDDQTYNSIKLAADAISDAEDDIEDAEESIDDNSDFTDAYVEAYVAALAAIDDQLAVQDSLKIGPEFARFSAVETLGVLEAEMQSIKDQIDALANTEITLGTDGLPTITDVVIFVDENGVEYTTIGSSTDEGGTTSVWAYINGADVDGAEDAITSAQKAVSDAENGQTTLEGLLAEAEIELMTLETQQTVWQGIADEIQALLLAELAG